MYRITCKDGRIFDAEEIRTHKGNLVLMMVTYPYHEADENGVSTYYWNDMYSADMLTIKSDEVRSLWPMKGNVMDEFDVEKMTDKELLAALDKVEDLMAQHAKSFTFPLYAEVWQALQTEWDSRNGD